MDWPTEVGWYWVTNLKTGVHQIVKAFDPHEEGVIYIGLVGVHGWHSREDAAHLTLKFTKTHPGEPK